MDLIQQVQERIVQATLDRLGPESLTRMAALSAATGVMPQADVYDRIRLADYILRGADPAQEYVEAVQLEKRTQTEDYPFFSGDVLVLGPQIFSSNDDPRPDTVISWRGVNFVPGRGAFPETVVGPDSDFGVEIPEREPAPTSGQGWQGRRG